LQEELGVMHTGQVRSIVVMGVSGSGKSTIARALAQRIGFEFIDGDALHSPDNLAKMSNGHALSDDDRTPWLNAIGQLLKDAHSHVPGCVVACSALKRKYRDLLREYVPDTYFVMLDGAFDLIQARLEARPHDFMPISLLASQFATLEPLQRDERGVRVDISLTPDEIVSQLETEWRIYPESG
jgi:carbohydrate kinase (thermoresistant glucokinase family)